MSADPEETRAMPSGRESFAIPPGGVLKDRYVVERELGRGAFGVVYLARDRQLLSKPVVIKVLQEQAAPDPWLEKKFRQEIESLSRIDHPGVVGVLDVGETLERRPFLVMQFVEGVTLRSAIGKNGMDLRRAGNILRQIGQALSAAHEKGVYHRDLKPENIMLQSLSEGEEYAKLIDFGIAAVRDSQVAVTGLSSKVAGSFGYMAPEQLMGKPCPASDIYSLGVIAFEMLTGRRPDMGADGVKTRPRELRAEIPEAAERVVLNALSFYPEQRPERPRDFGDHFAQALESVAPNPDRERTITQRTSRASETPSLEMAYVLFMDLVAYSTMAMDRQTEILQQLQEVVRGSPEFQRAQAGGQVVSLPTGDGMALVFFQNPVSAVQCAVEIARALRQQPAIRLRMGVHTGPVYRIADINTNRNVSGGGINLAQRVMDCGDAGHILVSKSVGDVLSQLSDWAGSLHDLGEHEVKHGVKIRLLNLYTADAGNPAIPQKLARVADVVPPQPLPPAQVRSHRGIYMLAGSVLTLAILIFAGVQVAEWRKTNAGPKPQPTEPAPAPAPVSPAAPVAEPQRSEQPESRPAAPRPKTAAPVEKTVVTLPPAVAAEPPKPVQQAAPTPPALDPAVAAQRAALQELRERMILLASRATAVRSSLDNLRAQQARSGLGLRSDMAAASQRVDYLMAESGAALKAGDAAALKRNLELAERDIEKLEGFFGR